MSRSSNWTGIGSFPKTTIHWDLAQQVIPKTESKVLPQGQLLSYGDGCLNDGATVVNTETAREIESFDPKSGIISAQAGVILKTILDHALAHSWILPVVPGTLGISLGGAIANDVHGKNHQSFGSFANHLLSFDLLRSDGTILRCSRSENYDYFRATVGGLGLTGLIIRATIQLRKISSDQMNVSTQIQSNLESLIEKLESSPSLGEYQAAWIDTLSTELRSLLTIANHVDAVNGQYEIEATSKSQWTLPCFLPSATISAFSVRAFNEFFYRSHQNSSKQKDFRAVLFPLDRVGQWNRLYGRPGFRQLQFQLPFGPKLSSLIRNIIKTFQEADLLIPLCVLKVFGKHQSEGILSFPDYGVTVALDIKMADENLIKLTIQLCQEMIVENGGRIYPAKDAYMNRVVFEKSFKRHLQFRNFVDPCFESNFWRRVR